MTVRFANGLVLQTPSFDGVRITGTPEEMVSQLMAKYPLTDLVWGPELPEMKMTRQDVYAAIDGERAYQETVWGPDGERRVAGVPQDGYANPSEHDVGSWMVFMDHYMNLAKAELSTKHGTGPALHQLRKVATLAVACFEQHGCPSR